MDLITKFATLFTVSRDEEINALRNHIANVERENKNLKSEIAMIKKHNRKLSLEIKEIILKKKNRL